MRGTGLIRLRIEIIGEPLCMCVEPQGSISHGVSSAVKISTGQPTGRRFFGRPRRRWEDNIRIDFKEIDANTRN